MTLMPRNETDERLDEMLHDEFCRLDDMETNEQEIPDDYYDSLETLRKHDYLRDYNNY